MTVLTPTKSAGAIGKPVAMTIMEPNQVMLDDHLHAFAAGSDWNGAFLADLLSSFLAHERCGVHLYRTVAGASENPVLKNGYERFLGQTEHHVAVLEELIARLGGNPLYVSPSARLVHSMNDHLTAGVVLAAGSADVLDREMAMLEAVVLAETKDHADWSLLASLAEKAPEGEVRRALRAAVDEVEDEEDEHITWAKDMWHRMAAMQVQSTTMMKVADFTEKAMAKVKGAFTNS
jgi:hypothetical protein